MLNKTSDPNALDVQLGDLSILQSASILRLHSLNFGADELLNNLRASSDECLGVDELREIREDGLEVRRVPDAVEQIIRFALLLDHGTGLV